MLSPRFTWVVAALLTVPACQTVETGRTLVSEPGELRLAAPARAWEVREDGDVIGLVVFFRSPSRPADSVYMVRNVWHQDLGLIDAFGRAYRYMPHQEDPAWVGSGTVAQGVERVLAARGPCELSEIPFPDVQGPASTPGEAQRRRKTPLEAFARADTQKGSS